MPSVVEMSSLVALFLSASLGHLVLTIGCHNWWYGQPFPKKVGTVLHLLHGLLFLAGPVALLAWQGWHFLDLLDLHSDCWGRQLAGLYLWVCWFAGLVLLPAITCYRNLRPQPRAIVSKQSTVVDFTEVLGYKPSGSGKGAALARLPFNQAFQVEYATLEVQLPKVPAAWDGLSILHLTDLHLRATPDRRFFQALIDRCNDPLPDLVCITGDIADSYKHQRWIVPVLGRLRWKIAAFAILGNHDYWYDPPLIRRRLKRLGIQYLGNSWQQLNVRGESLTIIGQEAPWTRPDADLSNCPNEPFRLCLSHTPDTIPWARRNAVDLMLAGHVHGGQIRLPIFGSVLVPSKFGRRFDSGTYQSGPTLLHVSRGISGEEPLRYGCRPEVTRIILRNGAMPV